MTVKKSHIRIADSTTGEPLDLTKFKSPDMSTISVNIHTDKSSSVQEYKTLIIGKGQKQWTVALTHDSVLQQRYAKIRKMNQGVGYSGATHKYK